MFGCEYSFYVNVFVDRILVCIWVLNNRTLVLLYMDCLSMRVDGINPVVGCVMLGLVNCHHDYRQYGLNHV